MIEMTYFDNWVCLECNSEWEADPKELVVKCIDSGCNSKRLLNLDDENADNFIVSEHDLNVVYQDLSEKIGEMFAVSDYLLDIIDEVKPGTETYDFLSGKMKKVSKERKRMMQVKTYVMNLKHGRHWNFSRKREQAG
jgi:DNA-directed RNA polymerase subunit RPC12/RpoP